MIYVEYLKTTLNTISIIKKSRVESKSIDDEATQAQLVTIC